MRSLALTADSRALSLVVTMLLTACWLAATSSRASAGDTSSILGFSADGAAQELSLEESFDHEIHPAELRDWLQRMSAEPNQVGSPHDKANADFMLTQFRQWGWDARIETFYVLYPTPKVQLLKMIAPHTFTASLREPPVAGDRTSSSVAHAGLPPYAVYGADGDVTAELVYVNYGMQDDYKELDRRGITVKGRIVLARYEGGWRGIKPRLAYERGAIGCIIYSDPRDDGYFRGDVYPTGGWRPAAGVQRGSVLDTPVYPGDPLTPGTGATKDTNRLSIAEAATIAKIPVLPISYADAEPLLAALQGPVAPEHWRGAVPVTYHLGPGPAKVHFVVKSDWTLKPVYDVIARIRGSEIPDEWVIRGNHHDGWVFGALDPLAGNVSLMEEAKAIGALLRTGWRPRRTLVYASWDAEEPGWIGSTEWAESHAEELQRHAVLYVNSDTNARGFLVAGGSHSLQHLVNEVASGIRDPETGVSVQTRLRAKLRVTAFAKGSAADANTLDKTAPATGDLAIAALGSGTDFTPFLQHLGITTLDLYYSGEDDGEGIWHSIYDSFDNYIRFGDPDFAYGVAEAETVGHVVLRVANATVLPLRIGDFADTMKGYAEELHKLAEDARHHATQLSALLGENAFLLASDPSHRVNAPQREAEVPYLDFAPLDNALVRLKRTAGIYDEAYEMAAKTGFAFDATRRAELNAMLSGLEQMLTDPRGLPGRTWFKHMIYAPGLYTGYAVKTVPGVRESIEHRDWHQADEYIGVTAHALQMYCDQVEQATRLLTALASAGVSHVRPGSLAKIVG
jgi:N-acetylated-alpha-linked acidic dipeptidase